MIWIIIVFLIIILINIIFGFKNGVWGETVVFVVLLLFLFMMNIVLPTFMGDLDVNHELLLESTLNEEKDPGYIISLFPDGIEKKILCGYSSYDELRENDFELAINIVNTISSVGVILFALIALLFGLFVLRPIGALHDMLLKVPIVSKFDKFIGIIIGLINSVIIFHMAFIGVAMYSNTKFGSIIYDMIYQSDLLINLYENNMLIKIFSKTL